MYICICNAVTDTEVSNHLNELGEKTSAKEAYMACTGGVGHVCGRCKPTMKDIVSEHNNKINVQQLSNAAKSETQKEPV